MSWLIAYAVLVTIALGWTAIELKAERASSRMVDEFRENDRKFYRGWENIWFKQLEMLAEKRVVKSRPKLPRKGQK